MLTKSSDRPSFRRTFNRLSQSYESKAMICPSSRLSGPLARSARSDRLTSTDLGFRRSQTDLLSSSENLNGDHSLSSEKEPRAWARTVGSACEGGELGVEVNRPDRAPRS